MWGRIVSPRTEKLALRSTIVPSSRILYLYAIVRLMGLHCAGTSLMFRHWMDCCVFCCVIYFWWVSAHSGASRYRRAI